jgi:hypothetical protein
VASGCLGEVQIRRDRHVTAKESVVVSGLFSQMGSIEMKRIALLVCGMLLLVSNTAEARWNTWTSGGAYAQQQTYVAPAAYYTRPAQPVQTAAYSTHTAQGVANLMAAYNRVGHWGGNTGYEGCGAGPTPAAAYNVCCYSNSGMTTVDVGYAQSASGMWYCCRRYR